MEGVIRKVLGSSCGRSRGGRWERRQTERRSLIDEEGRGSGTVADHDGMGDQRMRSLGALLARTMRNHLVGALELSGETSC